MPRFGLVAVLVISILGCSKDDSENDPLKSFTGQMDSIQCARRVACCSLVGHATYAVQDCQNYFAKNGVPLTTPAGGKFDPAAAQNCLTAMSTWDFCAKDGWLALIPACSKRKLFGLPPAALGESCEDSEDCSQADGPAQCFGVFDSKCGLSPVAGKACDPDKDVGRCDEERVP